MSIFGSIMTKIFGHGAEMASAASGSSGQQPGSAGSPSPARDGVAGSAVPTTDGVARASGGVAHPVQHVDIEKILSEMAAKSGQPSNWRQSIVDLMKLLGLDSSLQSRQELARELGYKGDNGDSASMNVWLHKQVMHKLAETGGKVPDNLKG